MGKNKKKLEKVQSKDGFEPPEDAEPKGCAPKKKGKEEAKPMVTWGQLFRYATGWEILLMIIGTLGAMGHGSILPLFSLIFGELVDAFTLPPDQIYDAITKASLYFLYAGIASLGLTYLQYIGWEVPAENQALRIRKTYFDALVRKHIGWFDKSETGALTARISGDIVIIKDGLGGEVSKAIQAYSTGIAGLILGFVKGWKITLVILAVSPLLMASGAWMMKSVTELTAKSQEAYAQAGGLANEVIAGIRTVASFSAEPKEFERYSDRLHFAKRFGIQKAASTGLALGMTMFFMFGSYALALWYGSTLVIAMEMSGGAVLTAFFSVLIGAFSMGMAGPAMEKVVAARGAAHAIWGVIDEPTLIDPLSEEGEKLGDVKGQVKFSKVKFTYPTRPDTLVMDEISFTVKPGTTVALVGPSGSGKSSIVSLIQKFYLPDSGTISVDGKNINEINTKSLRSHIAVVSQEPVLFSGTIKDNIRFGKPNATEEEVVEAARAANAHNFIDEFPERYDTQIGEKGAQLSGGQKQRIAIARAIIRNPKILLLDEATSALDTESEKIVQDALDAVKQGRTTIVVAHRLSTIRDADKILVISKGKVAEKGNHDELVEKGGIYAGLVHAQGSGDLEKKEHAEEKGKKEEVGKSVETVSAAIEEEATKKKKDVSMWRLFKLNSPETPYIVLACLASVIVGAVNPVFAIVFSQMINLYGKEKDEIRRDTVIWSVSFVGIGVAFLVFQTIQSVAFGIAGQNLTQRIRRITFKSILHKEIGWFDSQKHATGILTARLASEATLVEGLTGSRIALFIQNMVTLITGLVVAFIYGWKLTLVILCVTPLMILSSFLESRLMVRSSESAKKAFDSANRVVLETVGNIRTTASFTYEQDAKQIVDLRSRQPHRAALRNAQISSFRAGLGELFLFGSYTLGFWYGGKLVSENDMTFLEVMTVFMTITMTAMSIGQTSGFGPDIAKAKQAAIDIFELIDDKTEIDSEKDTGEKPTDFSGEVEFHGVEFEYPERKEVKVMRGLNLKAQPGKVLALVGQSGCGKSSSVALIERFYDVTAGKITFDGQDIRNLNIKWLRQQVGHVGQEPVLFTGTIADNIRYGKPDATLEEIQTAARAANAHNFIDEFPDKYDTEVGEKGAQLSGGQKQRVAIARAIIRNPKILLLDEATSALDNESEKIVQEALDSVMEGRTTIVIAHRLSTIKNADTIAVIEKGQVVEQGTHDELMQLNGAYYHLVQRQTK